jgi:hypothetical protein
MQLIFGTITLHELKHRAFQNEYEQDPVIKAHSDVRRSLLASEPRLVQAQFGLRDIIMEGVGADMWWSPPLRSLFTGWLLCLMPGRYADSPYYAQRCDAISLCLGRILCRALTLTPRTRKVRQLVR